MPRNKGLTWREVLEAIPKDQLNDNATIYCSETDEYYPIMDYGFCNDGVLDNRAFYLIY